jgi:DNA-binding GntR family transcriptional regulator
MRRDMVRGFSALADWQAERDHLVGEHEAIADRIEAHDQEGAARLLREHVLRFYSHVVEGSEEPHDEAPPSAA